MDDQVSDVMLKHPQQPMDDGQGLNVSQKNTKDASSVHLTSDSKLVTQPVENQQSEERRNDRLVTKYVPHDQYDQRPTENHSSKGIFVSLRDHSYSKSTIVPNCEPCELTENRGLKIQKDHRQTVIAQPEEDSCSDTQSRPESFQADRSHLGNREAAVQTQQRDTPEFAPTPSSFRSYATLSKTTVGEKNLDDTSSRKRCRTNYDTHWQLEDALELVNSLKSAEEWSAETRQYSQKEVQDVEKGVDLLKNSNKVFPIVKERILELEQIKRFTGSKEDLVSVLGKDQLGSLIPLLLRHLHYDEEDPKLKLRMYRSEAQPHWWPQGMFFGDPNNPPPGQRNGKPSKEKLQEMGRALLQRYNDIDALYNEGNNGTHE